MMTYSLYIAIIYDQNSTILVRKIINHGAFWIATSNGLCEEIQEVHHKRRNRVKHYLHCMSQQESCLIFDTTRIHAF